MRESTDGARNERGGAMTGQTGRIGSPRILSLILLLALLPLAACVRSDGADSVAKRSEQPSTSGGSTMPTDQPVVTRTDEEWKKLLTPQQYEVARRRGTEPPGGRAYEEFEKQGEGTYYCVCCGAELFTSKEKFNSGCGWPSFWNPSTAKNIAERVDRSLGTVRTEVVCRRCNAHLGHVFDGEGFRTPTDRRFCINAASMTFVPKGGAPPPLLDPDSPAVAGKKMEVAKEDPPEGEGR
jgi:peptide-methionine (R)-S-oxide reductase